MKLINAKDKIIKFNDKLNKYEYDGDDDMEDYGIQTPDELAKSEVGICWDYVSYEADYFNKHFPDVKYETYFWFGDSDDGNTHTFLIFNFNKKWYWFESAWKNKVGIYEFSNKQNALNYIINELIKPVKNYKKSYVTKYNALDKNIFGMVPKEFMNYMWDKCKNKPFEETEVEEKPN